MTPLMMLLVLVLGAAAGAIRFQREMSRLCADSVEAAFRSFARECGGGAPGA